MTDYRYALGRVTQEAISASRETGPFPRTSILLDISKNATVECYVKRYLVQEVPELAVRTGRIRRFLVSSKTQIGELRESLNGGPAAKLIERVLQGMRVVGKGPKRTGVLTVDASAAERSLLTMLSLGECAPRRDLGPPLYHLVFSDADAAVRIAKHTGASEVHDDTGAVVWRRDVEETPTPPLPRKLPPTQRIKAARESLARMSVDPAKVAKTAKPAKPSTPRKVLAADMPCVHVNADWQTIDPINGEVIEIVYPPCPMTFEFVDGPYIVKNTAKTQR